MEQQHKEWPAIRIIHLSGGCYAINKQDPMVIFEPPTLNGKQYQISIDGYGAVYQVLESLGIRIIGVDFYSNDFEVEGILQQKWISYNKTIYSSWLIENSAEKWANIGYAAFERKNGKLWDIGSRIGYQLKVCNWRLREISEAYINQLFAKVKAKNFEPGETYIDGFSWLSYLAIQSFLVDACILRDYLSEFMYEFIYKDEVDLGGQRITTMGALKKNVINKIMDPDDFTLELKNEIGKEGWITLLGYYRDLVVHSAPLAQAEKQLFSICDKIDLPQNVCLPIIRCPIPKNPKNIVHSRSKGIHFADFDNQLNSFLKAANGDEQAIDGLDYAHSVLGKLAILSEKIAVKSPIAPEKPTFDDSNIIGGITINYSNI